METLHTKEQTQELINLKKRLNEFFDFIIDLGQKEIIDKPNLYDCTYKDCLDWNNTANVDLMRSKVYSLGIEFNTYRNLLQKTNEIDYLTMQEIKNKKLTPCQNHT